VKKQKGFTLIELIVVIAIVMIAGVGIANYFLNSPVHTRGRATESMLQWVSENNIQTIRASCAPDSDTDGYASCTLVTDKGEKIFLQCTSSAFMNADTCKEVDGGVVKIQRNF
jgi:prepilin-type N-terminal cleavage/methylation domain-containing protein